MLLLGSVERRDVEIVLDQSKTSSFNNLKRRHINTLALLRGVLEEFTNERGLEDSVLFSLGLDAFSEATPHMYKQLDDLSPSTSFNIVILGLLP